MNDSTLKFALKTTTAWLMRGATMIGLLVSIFNAALADNVSRTFEFGEGTGHPSSHVRTFPVPCATEGGVAAVVKFQRLAQWKLRVTNLDPNDDARITRRFSSFTPACP